MRNNKNNNTNNSNNSNNNHGTVNDTDPKKHTSSSEMLMASILQVHPHGSDCPTTHSVSHTLLAGEKELPGQYLPVR